MKFFLAIVQALLLLLPVGEVAASRLQAGGCYLPLANGVAMGLNRKRQTVQLPIGRLETGESLEQTAARETLEETGIAVNVGTRLLTLREGSVAIFFCSPKTPVQNLGALSPVDTKEVQEVLVLNPHTLTNHDGRQITNRWRHPPLRFLLKLLYQNDSSPPND